MSVSLYDMYNDFRDNEDINTYKELYSYGEKLQKDAGTNNTLQYFESEVVPKLYKYIGNQEIEIDANKQQIRLMNYLLYYIDVSDNLPEELVYNKWQNEYITDYIACLEEDGEGGVFTCHPYQYYIFRNHRLPPTNWFVEKIRDKSEMDSIKFYEIIYKNFTSDDIIKLSQLIYRENFSFILYEVINYDLQFQSTKFIDKLQNLIKEHIVAIFEFSKYSLSDKIKFDGYQTQVNYGKTLFSLYLEHKYFNNEQYIPPKDLWFNGCLQMKYRFDVRACMKRCKSFLYLTPAQFVSYQTGILPPQELLYPGWEKETVNVDYYNGESVKIIFAHLWFLRHKKQVPQYLQYDGWDTQKFIYATMEQTIHQNTRVVQFYGTIKGAYNYYGIIDVSDKRFNKYKLLDNGQCGICFENKTIYNLCNREHKDGICLDCLMHMDDDPQCPFCRSKYFGLKLLVPPHIARFTVDFDANDEYFMDMDDID